MTVNLPKIALAARQKFEAHKDLIEPYTTGAMVYEEFAARVLRRSRGENEDGEFQSPEPGEPEQWE